MNEPILIGTYGWEHKEWEGEFYPPELPPEWRFCFYSNKIRSVIVPAGVWSVVRPADVTQWVDDSDPAFRFVLELPPALLEAEEPASAVDAFFGLLAPLRHLTAALLLPVPSAVSVSRLDALLDMLVRRHPVCLRALNTALTDGQRECAARHRASLCWRVGETEAPEAGGDFLVALMEDADPRRLRVALERIAAWQGGSAGAGLFFTRAETAASLAQDARLLAEIMQL